MTATLTLAHKAIGAEVRRGPYDIVVDGEQVGSVAMNGTFTTPVEPGRHTLQVRCGRNPSRVKTFDAADGTTVAFRALCGLAELAESQHQSPGSTSPAPR